MFFIGGFQNETAAHWDTGVTNAIRTCYVPVTIKAAGRKRVSPVRFREKDANRG
jgi:hypothetical protein